MCTQHCRTCLLWRRPGRAEELFQQLLDSHDIDVTVTIKAHVLTTETGGNLKPAPPGLRWEPGMRLRFGYYLNGMWDSISWPSFYTTDADPYITEEDLPLYPNGYVGQHNIAADFAHRLTAEELEALGSMTCDFDEYGSVAGSAVSSAGYGLVAVALAEATVGRRANWDCAFDDDSHQGDTAAEFVNWWGDRQIAFYKREGFMRA